MSFAIFFLINVIRFVKYLLLIRVILSWFADARQNRFFKLVYDFTEPVLSPIRKFMPSTGILDFSVLVAYLLLEVIEVSLYRYYMTLV